MPDLIEQQRLEGLYEKLRLKLLDLSKKNRMLNYSLGVRSQRYLQIVDDTLADVYARLASEEARLRISFLPEPDDLPVEEKTEDFLAALEHAKVSDIDYATKLDALETEGRDDEIELARLERQLRDRVRAQLGLPPRATRAEVNRTEHARSLGIDPGLELQAKRPDAARVSLALQTLKYPDELERVADKILGQARLAEQEMGVSTLFLAFGFLEWYESDDSDKKAYAPLLLLPVKLDTEKVRGKEVYYLSAREGAAEPNLSLQNPAVSVRQSVRPDCVVCLDCGYRGKTLRRHIASRHGLSRAEYLKRWGLKPDHPLTAPAYSEHRSTVAKQLGLGRSRCLSNAELNVRIHSAPAGTQANSGVRAGGAPTRGDTARQSRPCEMCRCRRSICA